MKRSGSRADNTQGKYTYSLVARVEKGLHHGGEPNLIFGHLFAEKAKAVNVALDHE